MRKFPKIKTMKRQLIFMLLLLFVGIGCSDKKNTQTTLDKKNIENTNVDSVDNLKIRTQKPFESKQENELTESELEESEYYNKKAQKCNSTKTYRKFVTIGTDTVFFKTDTNTFIFKIDVGNITDRDNFILPYTLRKQVKSWWRGYPIYSIAVLCEKNDLIAIFAWMEGECYSPDLLLVFEKSTGILSAFEVIAENDYCFEYTKQNTITLKNDSLIVYEVIDNYHVEEGYTHYEYKNCFIVKSDGGIEKKELLSVLDKFENGHVDSSDQSAMHFFKLMSLISDVCLEKCDVEWNDSDRKSMLYQNAEYGLLVKSHPQMRSINYSNNNLEVDFSKSFSNFHLYQAADGREFLTISTVDSSLVTSRLATYQYNDSQFVEINDFFPTSLSQDGAVFKSFLFDGDRLTINRFVKSTSQTDMLKYEFDKSKGVMVDCQP